MFKNFRKFNNKTVPFVMSLNTNYAINKPTIKQTTYFKTITSKMLPLIETVKKSIIKSHTDFINMNIISSFDNLDLYYRFVVAWLFAFFYSIFFG